MKFFDRFTRPLAHRLALLGAAILLAAPLVQAKPLRIGVTLHPYYSYVANIVGKAAEVVPVIPAGFNPHAYEPRAEDIKRIGTLDVLVMNGVGHDDFADRMVAASEKPRLPVIEANANVPLLAATGTAPIAWRVVAGQLPLGLSIDESTGVIAGTPLRAETMNFVVEGRNAVGADEQSLQIEIENAEVPGDPNPPTDSQWRRAPRDAEVWRRIERDT